MHAISSSSSSRKAKASSNWPNASNKMNSFRINKYNWFGQKLLALNDYEEIIYLRQHLSDCSGKSVLSDHLNYIHGLALVKTSAFSDLGQLIISLQALNFDENKHYLLLLCQCLFYLGRHESIVALCKQLISREIDAQSSDEPIDRLKSNDSNESLMDEDGNSQDSSQTNKNLKAIKNCLKSFASSSSEQLLEFERFFEKVSKSQLINEPNLWQLFGLSSEYQFELREAQLAFQVASRLATGKQETNQSSYEGTGTKQSKPISYYNSSPHLNYSNFCIKYKNDFKIATEVLKQACSLLPQNFELHSLLALTTSVCQQPTAAGNNYQKSLKLLSNLENLSAATRNPATGYNELARKLKFKFQLDNQMMLNDFQDEYFQEAGDKFNTNLKYQLIKVHVTLNSLFQELNYRLPLKDGDKTKDKFQLALNQQVDKLIEFMKSSHPSGWCSAALWNNLGVCFLIKRKFTACLACLTKANQINQLDWRINYNLALAYAHLGLSSRALNCLIAAKRSLAGEKNHLVATLLAICASHLNQIDEARKLYIGVLRPGIPRKSALNASSPTITIPILSLVNYLIFLHNDNHPNDNGEQRKQTLKLKLYLLDQIEQAWLQRYPQNDPQFNTYLLGVAKRIGDETFAAADNINLIKKNYAWTKIDFATTDGD